MSVSKMLEEVTAVKASLEVCNKELEEKLLKKEEENSTLQKYLDMTKMDAQCMEEKNLERKLLSEFKDENESLQEQLSNATKIRIPCNNLATYTSPPVEFYTKRMLYFFVEQPLSFTQTHGIFFRFRGGHKSETIVETVSADFQLILCGEVGI